MERSRIAGASGAIGIGLLLVALFLPGPPPKSSDSVAHLTQVLIDKRTLLLVGTGVAGVGAAAFLWFLGTLHRFLRTEAGADGEAAVASAGGVAAVILMLVGVSITSALALGTAGAGDAPLIRAGTDLGNILIELSKLGLAVLVAATCVAARRASLFDARMTAVGLAAAAVLVVSALPPFLADHGIWQFGGGPEVGGGVPGAAWVIWLSVHLAGRSSEASDPCRIRSAAR